jgi:hypothetical protein
MNTWHYACTINSGPAPDYVAEMAALYAGLNATGRLLKEYAACLSDNIGIDPYWFQVISPDRYVKQVIGGEITGGLNVDTLVGNTQASITRRGDFANRSNVGAIRIPLPTFPETASDGQITPGHIERLEDLAIEMLNSVSTGSGARTWLPVLYHRNAQVRFSQVTGVEVQHTARVIRRRTLRVGI